LIFDESQPALFYLRSNDDKDAEFMKVYEEAAKENEGKIVFAYSDMTGKTIEKLAEIWDINPKDMPMLIGHVPKENKIMYV
jgi:hypothetical protein